MPLKDNKSWAEPKNTDTQAKIQIHSYTAADTNVSMSCCARKEKGKANLAQGLTLP